MGLGFILNNVSYTYVVNKGCLISLRKGHCQSIDIAVDRVANNLLSRSWSKSFEMYGTHMLIKSLDGDVFYTVDISEVANSCLISNSDAKLVIQKAQVTKEVWERNQKHILEHRSEKTEHEEILEIVDHALYTELSELTDFACEQKVLLQTHRSQINALKEGEECSEKKIQYKNLYKSFCDTLMIIERKKMRVEISGSNSSEEQELFKRIDALLNYAEVERHWALSQ
jgi:hypothetical protein